MAPSAHTEKHSICASEEKRKADCVRRRLTRSGFNELCTIPAPVNNEAIVSDERNKNWTLCDTGRSTGLPDISPTRRPPSLRFLLTATQ